MSVQIHDTKRCPECDTLGTIDDLETRSNKDYDARTRRSRKRIYECPDCDERWVYYV
jgi:uncharacterized protein YlaI